MRTKYVSLEHNFNFGKIKTFLSSGYLYFLIIATPFMLLHSGASIVSASDYYVAKDGLHSNPGTSSQPWLTIQKAADTLSAGDTVYVKAGTYNERVRINVEGNPQSGYITFRNYNNDKVIIDGQGFDLSSPWGGLFESFNKSYIRMQGFHILNAQNGMSILFHGQTGETTSHIEILNNEVTAHNGSSAIAVRTNIAHVLIENNEVHHCDTGVQEAIRVCQDVYYFKILNNTVHNNTNIGIDCVGRELLPAYGLIKNNTCYRNGTVGDGAHGIYIDGGEHIVIEDNICFDNRGGIAIGTENQGDVTHHIITRRNIVYNNWSRGITFGSCENCGRPENCTIVHNTFFNNNSWGGSIQIRISYFQGTSQVKNNIFHDTNSSTSGYLAFYLKATPLNEVKFDYNCYFTNYARFSYDGKSYDTFTKWQTATGMDAHSLTENPGFVDAPNYDFHLATNSPCIDTGESLTKTISSGSGAIISIEDARYFCDGYDGLFRGDMIQVGSNHPVIITKVDYTNNTIIVSPNISWKTNDGVSYLFTGAKPDIGAHEFATGIISGFVSAKDTSMAIPGATVSTSIGYSTTTDLTGKYVLCLPIGKHSITASKNGYLSQFEFATVTVGETTSLDLHLICVASSPEVFIYPNPYVKGENTREIIFFGNLPKTSTIRIYTLSGKLVKTIEHKDTADGSTKEWDISDRACGLYVFYIKSSSGENKGKISIIK